MQKLLSGPGGIVLLNLLTKPLWILTENAVQNEVGHADFGRYSALYAGAMILASVFDAGLNQYLTKTIAPQPERFRELFRTFLTVKLTLLAGYLLFCVLAGWVGGFSVNDMSLLLICGGIHAGIGGLFAVRAVLQGFQSFGTDGWSSVADKVILMLLLFIGLINFHLTVHHYAGLTLLVTWAVAGYFSLMIIRRYGWGEHPFGYKKAGDLLRFSFPLALITLLFTVNEHLNKILVQHLGGDKEAGLFAGAFRWFGAFSMYLWTLLPVFYARFAKMKFQPVADRQKLFDTALILSSIPILLVTGAIFFFGEKLFFLFGNSSPDEISSMTSILKILALALLINAYFNVFSTYLTSTGGERYVNFLLVGAILLGNGFNYVFIPRWGGTAAAWGLVIAFGWLSAGYLYFFAVETPLKIPVKILIKLFLLAGIYIGTLALLHYWQLHPALNLALSGTLCLLSAYFSGLLKKENLVF